MSYAKKPVRYAIGALIAALYFLGGRLGLELAFVNASATAVWIPAGIALASLLRMGLPMWPAVFAGAFLVNISTQGSVPVCLGIAAGNTMEALAGAYLVRRWAGGERTFDQPRRVLLFAIFAGMAAPVIAATVGVACLAAGGLVEPVAYTATWLTWWLGDLAGVIIVTPVLITWVRDWRRTLTRGEYVETLVFTIVLLGASGIVFGGLHPSYVSGYPLAFLVLPLLTWAAVRFRIRGVAATVVWLSAITIVGTLQGEGPYADRSPNEALLLLQAFMATAAVTTFTLSAAIGQIRSTARDLWEAKSKLEQRVVRQDSDIQSARQGMKAEERRFRTVADAAQEPILTIDDGGRILYCNPATERVFGYPEGRLEGKMIDELASEESLPDFVRPFRTRKGLVSSSRINLSLEVEGQRQDGTRFPMEVFLGASRVGEEFIWTAILHDVTNRVHTEQERRQQEVQALQSRKLEALGRLAAGVAHEISTPLQYIGDNLEFLQEVFRVRTPEPQPAAVESREGTEVEPGFAEGKVSGDPDGEVKRAIATSLEGIGNVRELVLTMRAFAHPTTVAKLRVDLNELIRNAVRLTRVLWRREVEVVMELDPSLPWVYCHPGEIGQVMVNLITNAKQAARESRRDEKDGPNRVTLRSRKLDHEVEVRIEDTGPGIPEKWRSRIFEPFFTTKPVGEGSGQGLAISRLIVAKHHKGMLEFETEEGTGTTFIVRLPLKEE